MFISEAWAVEATADLATGAADVPGTGETLLLNFAFIAFLVGMFYFLMIRPQQKRIKEHSDMLSSLDKGTSIVTQGGLIGEIDKLIDDKQVRVNLGNDVKVKVLRSAISAKLDDFVSTGSANDK